MASTDSGRFATQGSHRLSNDTSLRIEATIEKHMKEANSSLVMPNGGMVEADIAIICTQVASLIIIECIHIYPSFMALLEFTRTLIARILHSCFVSSTTAAGGTSTADITGP